MVKAILGYDLLKRIIPYSLLNTEKADRYHVYEVYADGTSKLLGIFYYKHHAKEFKKMLERQGKNG